MAKRKTEPIRVIRVKKGESLKSIYAKARKAFTAADLQKFTVIEEGVPAREILAEMEAFDAEQKRKKKGKPRNGRNK